MIIIISVVVVVAVVYRISLSFGRVVLLNQMFDVTITTGDLQQVILLFV